MSNTLLPCPFCGHKPKMRNGLNSENEPYYQARHDCMCLLSEIKTFCCKTEAEAIAAWNHRADAMSVVRCEDCKHYNRTGCSDGFGWCESMDRGVSDDFYCANGAKMESEDK